MHRIDTPTAQVDKFGAGKNGFTRGNPQTGVPATALDDDYFDAIQEEIAKVIESTGEVLDKTNRAQLLTAIAAIIGNNDDGFLKKVNNLSEIKDAGPAAVADALKNLTLTAMGIGLPSITAIANFDWQNFVFTLGANYLASSTNWLNVPAGVSYATGLPISITVDYITNDANNIGLTLIPNTVNNASFIVYKVSVFGAVGSRAFAVRDIPTSANPVPTSGRLLNTQVFASNGTYNPTAGTAYIEVEAVGAGGASGSLSATGAGQGAVSVPGSNGAYALASFTTGFSGGINVAVGVGGQGIFGNGPKGGDTTFGALLTCPGGPGSSVSLALNPPSYSSPPSGPAIPTVSGGGKLIKLTYGNRLNPAAMLAVGVFTNYRATDLTPFGLFGVGADGQIGNSSSVAIIGASGNSGYLIVREYS